MARTAAERRAARKRKQQARRPPGGEAPGAAAPDQDLLVGALVVRGAATADAWEFERVTEELARLDPEVDSAGHASRLLVGLLRGLWEHGWQPADVAHVVGKHASRRSTRLVVAAMAEEFRTCPTGVHAPDEWRAQLAGVGAVDGGGPAVVAEWARAERLAPVEAWREALGLMGPIDGLVPLQALAPPPSRWRAGGRPNRRTPTTADSRVLGRIRGLLAKAESTDFPEEAEALSAKAQELMTRHAVDAAVLDADAGRSVSEQVGARRMHITDPYAEPKVRLLDSVGTANGVRVIWLERLGIATMVGLSTDLNAVDLLFTSLLVQATRAMTETGRAGGPRTRSPSFRRGFLTAYAVRIGQRLADARDRVTATATTGGGDLLPVLRARDEAVDEAFTAMFPETYAKETRSFDARGWYAGLAAAEDAHLGSGRDQVSG